jgi:hypothetical protein
MQQALSKKDYLGATSIPETSSTTLVELSLVGLLIVKCRGTGQVQAVLR